MMKKVRVLCVEDSPTVRDRLCSILAGDPEIELIGEAENGKQAIDMCLAHRPDVITMDMIMPVMSGLAATEYVMAHCPTPILVVSASFNRGELFKTYDALAAGAVDVMEKPRGDEPEGEWEREFLSTVKLVSRIRVITHLRGRHRGDDLDALAGGRSTPTGAHSHTRQVKVAAIGASTGGPNAILDVVGSLPLDFNIPILLVLHIGGQFGTAFAEWLDGVAGRPVAIARDGDPVATAAGRIAMAPPDRHLVVRDGRMWLTRDAERHSCRPSVDVLFESLASDYGAAAAGCLLTGMGRDGATGLLAMRNAGAATIAQDEATCVVYGMPREAALLGAAERILPIDEIGPALASIARHAGGRA